VNYIDETTYALDGDWDNGDYSVVVRAAGGGIGQKTKVTSISGTRITVADNFDPALDTSTYYSIVNDTWYDAYDQEVTNTYFWQNRNGETAMNVAISTATAWWFSGLAENTNYFVENASFDGTAGVGCGTLGNRPATCTTGVGYWATDQGNCSDLTGYVGANATEIVGKLYKCTATDTWTEYYTPYDYPHPLRDEESAPTLTVTVTNTGAGHSPSHDGARSVQTGGTLTFTSGVYNGWKVTIAGTCGCSTDGCTVTPTENCEITCTSSEIQLMPW
jgi:hypothetical protein